MNDEPIMLIDLRVKTDPRVADLAERLGLTLNETLGALLCVWQLCYQNGSTDVHANDIEAASGIERFASGMLHAGLATHRDEGFLYVHGSHRAVVQKDESSYARACARDVRARDVRARSAPAGARLSLFSVSGDLLESRESREDTESKNTENKKDAHVRAREVEAANAIAEDLAGIDTVSIAPDLDGELREAVSAWLVPEWTVSEHGRRLVATHEDFAFPVHIVFDVTRPREKTVAALSQLEGARVLILRRAWKKKPPSGVDLVIGLDCKQTQPISRTQMRAVTDVFGALYRERAHGEHHRWFDRHFANAKKLIRESGADEVIRRIGILFDDPPRWLSPPFTFDTLVSQWNVLVVSASEAERAHNATRPSRRGGQFDPSARPYDARTPRQIMDDEDRASGRVIPQDDAPIPFPEEEP